jgi:ADP-ribose pyrophosphatase
MSTSEAKVIKVEPLDASEAKWIEFQKLTWKDRAGVQRTWEAASRKTRKETGIDAVAITPILLSKNKPASTIIILQYRPPIQAICVEFPAGLIDAGETVEQAALRELREETGYDGRIVDVSPAMANDPGMSTSNMVMVVAEVDVKDGEELPEQHLDEGESIERIVVPLNELYERLQKFSDEGKIVDSRLWHWAEGVKWGIQNNAKYQLSK